jgi:hypothetical protein
MHSSSFITNWYLKGVTAQQTWLCYSQGNNLSLTLGKSWTSYKADMNVVAETEISCLAENVTLVYWSSSQL